MGINKVVEFAKTRKKELVIAAGTVTLAVGFILYAIMRKKLPVDLPIPELNVGKINELWRETQGNGEQYINAIVDELTVADLGRFGEEMMKVDGIDLDTTVSAIIGFGSK